MRTLKPLLALIVLAALPLRAADFPEIEGFAPKGEVKTFGPDSLWQQIDGADGLFLSYGVRQLRLRDLTAGGVTLTVSLYDMGTPLNAFGVYAKERGDEPKRLPIGAEAVLFPPYQGLLLKGATYVKVDASEGELSESLGKDLLTKIAAALPGDAGLPPELRSLPAEGLLPGSEAYARQGFLGLSELSNVVSASYRGAGGAKLTLFRVLPAEGAGDEAAFKALGEKWKPVPEQPFPVAARTIPYKGPVAVALTGKGLFGATGLEAEADLLKVLASLPIPGAAKDPEAAR